MSYIAPTHRFNYYSSVNERSENTIDIVFFLKIDERRRLLYIGGDVFSNFRFFSGKVFKFVQALI